MLGEGQFLMFWNTRLVQVKIPIDESIKSNNLTRNESKEQ